MRRGLVRSIAVANAFCLAAGLFVLNTTYGAASPGSADAQGQPNIVVFMTDDQTVDDMRMMKRTRELLTDRGISFANSFVSFPLCCPSRATYLSGTYAHNHGVLFNDPPFGYEAAADVAVMPDKLRQRGYKTIHVGKYFNGYGLNDPTEVPRGWSSFHATVGTGMHLYHGYSINHNGTVATYGDPRLPDPKTYLTDVLRKVALEEIGSAVASTAPFFLSLSFLAPHGEVPFPGQVRPEGNPRGAPRHEELYPDQEAPRDPSFDEETVADKPSEIRDLPLLGNWGQRYIDILHRARWRSLKSVDETVAKVVRRIDELGQLENTWFIFTSDNGFFSGQHRLRHGKYLPYEPSIRVPLIIAGPDIAASAVSHQLVSNVDLAPTILDLAGIPSQARSMDGRSLTPFLADPGLAWQRTLLLESGPSIDSGKDTTTIENLLLGEREIIRLYQGIRTERFKYIEYRDGEIELYDLVEDPFERHSLHADPFFQSLLPLFRAALGMLGDCAGAACRSAESKTLGVVGA